MGTPLMRKAGIRCCASHMQADDSGRSPVSFSAPAALAAAGAEESSTELCRPQECGMNWVWLWGRRRWHGEWAAPLFFFLPAFSQRDRGSTLVKIRKVGDGKWMGVGGWVGGQDSSPRSPISSQLYHWDPPQHSSVSICRWKINNLFRRPSFSSEETSFPRSSVHFLCSYHSVFSL